MTRYNASWLSTNEREFNGANLLLDQKVQEARCDPSRQVGKCQTPLECVLRNASMPPLNFGLTYQEHCRWC
jgi:hypothetical protein